MCPVERLARAGASPTWSGPEGSSHNREVSAGVLARLLICWPQRGINRGHKRGPNLNESNRISGFGTKMATARL